MSSATIRSRFGCLADAEAVKVRTDRIVESSRRRVFILAKRIIMGDLESNLVTSLVP